MTNRTYFNITGLIFLIIAIMHLCRLFRGWEVVFNGYSIPMWISWAGVIVAGLLAIRGLKGVK